MWTWIFNSLKIQATIWRPSFSENFSVQDACQTLFNIAGKIKSSYIYSVRVSVVEKMVQREEVDGNVFSSLEGEPEKEIPVQVTYWGSAVQVKLTREWGKKERSRCWCGGSWSLSSAWFHRELSTNAMTDCLILRQEDWSLILSDCLVTTARCGGRHSA